MSMRPIAKVKLAVAAIALVCGTHVAEAHAANSDGKAPVVEAGSFTRDQIDAESQAPLELIINGVHRGVSIAYVFGRVALVPVDDLLAAGVELHGLSTMLVNGKPYIQLSSIPGATFVIDDQALTLELTLPVGFLPQHSIDFASADYAKVPRASASGSAFLNYDLSSPALRSAASSLFLESGYSTNGGVFDSSFDVTGHAVRRGLSDFVNDSQNRLRRLTIGDTVASAGDDPLGGSTTLGGIGFARDFSLQPGFIRYPTPGFAGTVLRPTTAEVYVDGVLVRSVPLEPGPFNLQNIPAATGANVTKVVLTDAAGNTSDYTQGSYLDTSLLRRGVNDYGYFLGANRPSTFGEHDSYGAIDTLGDFRVGITDAWTAGARFEEGSGVISGGITSTFALPIGAIALDIGYSRDGDLTAGAQALTYAYTTHSIGLSAALTHIGDHYANLSLPASSDRATLSSEESVTISVGNATLGLNHDDTRYRDATPVETFGASFATVIARNISLNVAAGERRGNALTPGLSGAASHAFVLSANLITQIGTRSIAQTGYTSDNGHVQQTALISRAEPIRGEGVGYSAQVTRAQGETDTRVGLDLDDSHGRLELVTQTGDGPSETDADLSGSIVAFRQGTFFTRELIDGYALVHVDGANRLPIYAEGEPIGRTNGNGDIVVPNLTAYTENRVEIPSQGVPENLIVDTTVEDVVPRYKSGVVAEFRAHAAQAFIGTVTVHGTTGTIVPAYGILTLARDGSTQDSDLGTSGDFYFENLVPGTYRATVEFGASGHCSFDLTVPAASGVQVDLGAKKCFL